jgi:flavin reductase (DIM6/NTAB) family NADH-FMN oxidoreductase RutF/rubredoxin
MIDYEVLFKISYGLYIVCSGSKERGNGYISNTVFQVTSEPPHFATCCNKENHTAGLIQTSGVFSVSVLHIDTGPDTIGTFGYKSGSDTDKLKGKLIRYGETGAPIVLTDTIAFMEFRVTETIDVGTHLMFIGKLVHSEILDDDAEPLTYQYYRDVKKGSAPKNAPTYIDRSKLVKSGPGWKYARYECPTCGYIYDEEKEGVRFEELPDNWVCPDCGERKSEFIKL